MTDERRRQPRVPIQLPVGFDYVHGGHGHLEGCTVNISSGGARLDLGETVDVPERGVLVLELGDEVVALAVIAQPPTEQDRRENATRVQFWRMSERARKALASVLANVPEG